MDLKYLKGLSKREGSELRKAGVTKLEDLLPEKVQVRPGPLTQKKFLLAQKQAQLILDAIAKGKRPAPELVTSEFFDDLKNNPLPATAATLQLKTASLHRVQVTNISQLPLSLSGTSVSDGSIFVPLGEVTLLPGKSFSIGSGNKKSGRVNRRLPGTSPLFSDAKKIRLLYPGGDVETPVKRKKRPRKKKKEGDDPREQHPPPTYGEELDDRTIEIVKETDPDILMPCIPHFIHVPFSVASEPPRTPKNEFLSSSFYKVVSVDPDAKSVRLELKVRGGIRDPLINILSVSAEIKGPRNTESVAFLPGEFTDFTFKKDDVPVEGLGRSRVKFEIRSKTTRVGSTYFVTFVGIKPENQTRISDLEALIEAKQNDPATPSPSTLDQLRQQLRQAWQNALEDPFLQIRHVQKGPYNSEIEEEWKFMVKIRGVGNLATLQDQPSRKETPPKTTFLQLYKPGEYLSFDPPTDPEKGGKYFVTLPPYEGDIRYENEGLLHGNPLEAMEAKLNDLVYFQSAIYGVSLRGPRCKVLRTPDDYAIFIAQGLPDPCRGRKMEYSFDVVTAPEGATWRFDPPGPSPSPITHFFASKSGHYTIRVTGDVDDIGCPHVHDTWDADIEVRGRIAVGLLRLGSYTGALLPHLTRPYYFERALATAQGAEILFRPSFGDMGTKFRATLRFPAEIRIHRKIAVRVYTTPDRTEWIDFTGSPYITYSGNEVRIEVETIDEMYGAHVIRMYYDDVMKLKGQAVKVEIEYPQAPSECAELNLNDAVSGVLSTGASFTSLPPTMSTTTAVVAPDSPESLLISAPEEWINRVILVNLLLFNRDLGDPAIGFCERKLDGDHAYHNAANGNAFLPVALPERNAHGYVGNVEFCYNSLHISYGAALKDLMLYNGVPLPEIQAEYDSWLFGPGWTCNFDMRVFDYVVARGENNELLLERMELVCPDGNRLHFKKTGPTLYEPLYETDVFEGEADHSLSLRIEITQNGFLLTDKYKAQWTFDDKGRLVEIGDLRTTAGKMKPLKIQHTAGAVRITDTMERVTRLTKNPLTGAIIEVRDGAGRKTVFQYRLLTFPVGLQKQISIPLISQITDPIQRTRHFKYDPEFFFMVEKTNRRGFVVTFAHYNDRPPADVPAKVNVWFWGRLKSFEDGTRKLLIKYLESWPGTPPAPPSQAFRPIADGQPVELFDAEQISAFTKIDLNRLAAVEHWLKKKSDGTLKKLSSYVYRGLTKALDNVVDLFGQTTTYRYEKAKGYENAYNLRATSDPEGNEFRYTYTDNNRVETVRHPNGNRARYQYDDAGNVKRLEHGRTRVSESLNSIKFMLIAEDWLFDDESFLLEKTDPRGFKTTYQYDGAGPRLGLPTSELHDVEKGDQKAKITTLFSISGFPRTILNELTGLLLVTVYDDANRVKSETRAGSRMKRYEKTIVYNEHDLNTMMTDNIGRTEEAVFNRHDEEELRKASNGASFMTAKFDGHGNPLEVQDPTGRTKTYEWDELDRLTAVHFPPPEGENEQHASFEWIHDDENLKTIEKHGIRTTTFVYDRARRTKEIQYDEGDSLQRKMVFDYRPGNKLASVVERFANGVLLNNVTYNRNRLGDIVGIRQETGTDTYFTEIIRNATGNVTHIFPPRYSARPAGRPGVKHEYDGLRRRIETRDSYDRIVEKRVFNGSTLEIQRPSPDQPDTGTAQPTLTTVTEQTLDAAGRVVRETSFGETVRYIYDAAGRLTEIRPQNAARVVMDHDPIGAVTAVKTYRSGISKDNKGVFRVRDNQETVISYVHDPLGNLMTVTGEDQTIEYGYDEMGRRISEKRNGADYLKVAYDSLGRVKKITTALGAEITVQYDESQQKVTHTYRRGNKTEQRVYTLDRAGWLKEFTNSESLISLVYEHNGLGKLQSVEYKKGNDRIGRVNYLYDQGGNRQSKTVRVGNAPYRTTFAHDANGRLTRLDPPRGPALDVEYNPAGLLRKIDRPNISETEFRHAEAADLDAVFHNTAGSPRMRYTTTTVEYKKGRPERRRLLARVFKGPTESHLQQIQNTFARDGKLWKSVITDTVTGQQGARIQITTTTAFKTTGAPTEVQVETQILDHRSLQGKKAIARTSFNYRPDGRLQTLVRVATDIDGNFVERTVMSFGYDIAGNLIAKSMLHENSERKKLREYYQFQYDGLNQLSGAVFFHSKDAEPGRQIKRVEYFYGPLGELLGEVRSYQDPDMPQFLEDDDGLKGRPNPLFYLHDQGTNEALISQDKKLYLYTSHAPGGAYPLMAAGSNGFPFYPHQDDAGTTQFFTNRSGQLLRYAPLAEGEKANPVERAGSVSATHRLGDGALENVWPSLLNQPSPRFRYLGEGLPFPLLPQEPTDLTSFTDNEASGYGQFRLGQLSALEIAIAILKVLQYFAPHKLAYLIVDGIVETWKRRYSEFSELGVVFPSGQATNAAIGDFIGYTDLLEALYGVDTTTSTSLSTGRRWFKGVWGAVSLLTLGAGSALKGIKAAQAAKPAAQATRLIQGQHLAKTGWDVALQFGNHLDAGFGVLAIGEGLYGSLDDPFLRNGPSPRKTVNSNYVETITPRGQILINKVPVFVPNRRVVPFVGLMKESYHNAYRQLFGSGSYIHEGIVYGVHRRPGLEGKLADEMVKKWIKKQGQLRRRLNDIGINPRDLEFEFRVSEVTNHNMDILWEQGRFFLDFKRTIGIGTKYPGPSRQFQEFLHFAELNSFYFSYIGAREKSVLGSVIRAIGPLR